MEWIKITDTKPPLGVPLIVTVRTKVCDRLVLLPVYYVARLDGQGYGFCNKDGALKDKGFEVIAYMPFPKPYDGDVEFGDW